MFGQQRHMSIGINVMSGQIQQIKAILLYLRKQIHRRNVELRQFPNFLLNRDFEQADRTDENTIPF